MLDFTNISLFFFLFGIFVSFLLFLQHFKNSNGINNWTRNSILWYHTDTYIILLQAQKLSVCTGPCCLRKWVITCTDKYSQVWEPPGSGRQWRSFLLPPASLIFYALIPAWPTFSFSSLPWASHPHLNQPALPSPSLLEKDVSDLPLWHVLCFCNSHATSLPPPTQLLVLTSLSAQAKSSCTLFSSCFHLSSPLPVFAPPAKEWFALGSQLSNPMQSCICRKYPISALRFWGILRTDVIF